MDELFNPDEVFNPDFNPDDFSPDWFHGVVSGVKRDFLILELESPKGENFRQTCPYGIVKRGLHSLCLPVGTKVRVRLTPSSETFSGFFATDIEIPSGLSTPKSFEEAMVTHWSGHVGTATRDCGCPIMVTRRRSDKRAVSVGTKVQIMTVKDRGKLGYVGLIQKIFPKEEQHGPRS